MRTPAPDKSRAARSEIAGAERALGPRSSPGAAERQRSRRPPKRRRLGRGARRDDARSALAVGGRGDQIKRAARSEFPRPSPAAMIVQESIRARAEPLFCFFVSSYISTYISS